MPKFSKTSRKRLETCDQRLQLILEDAIKITDFTVLCGHRGKSEQNEAVRKGASHTPYPKSKHNTSPSVAVDVAPYPIDWLDRESFAYLAGVIMACAANRGVKLRWGNDWDGDGQMVQKDPDERFSDMPHFEIKE